MLVAQAITSEKSMGGTSVEVICISSSDFDTLDGIEWLTRLTQSEAHAEEVILEVVHLIRGTEGVLFSKAILGDVKLVRETSETPSGVAFDEDTWFEICHSDM